MLESPSFWTSLAFIVFVILVGRPVLKIILKFLDDRCYQIKVDIDAAAKLRHEAEEYLYASKSQLQEAKEQAKAIIEHAVLETDRLKSEARHKLEELIRNEERITQERIEIVKSEALAEIKKQAVQIAVQVTEKILVESIDAQENDRFLDEALKDIEESDSVFKTKMR